MIGDILKDSMHIFRFFKSRMGKKHNYKLKVMLMLKHRKEMNSSCIADKLFVAKPNLSKIIDKLVNEELIESLRDENDRRIINLRLTKKGEKYLEKKRIIFEKKAEKKFSDFSKEEISIISKSLNNIKKIIDKKGVNNDN